MEHRTKRNLAIINLISDFERNCENGAVGYLEEKSFLDLIHYYETEFLVDKAIEVVDFAINQFTYRSDFYIIKARLLLRSNQLEEALAYLDIAETIAPFEIEVRLLRAKAFSLQGHYEEANATISELKSYATSIDLSEIYICESYYHEAQDNFEEMYDSLKCALEIDPKNHEALDRILIAIELAKNYEESIEFLKTLLNKEPYTYLAWFNLGHAYSSIGEYQDAINALEYSFIIHEHFEAGYLDCAELCFQTQRFSKALELYIDANKKFGPDAELLLSIATCYYELNEIDKSKEILFEATKSDSFNDEVFYLIARCFEKEENWVSAVNAYHKAMKIEDRREEYYAGVAKAYVALDEPKKANYYFRKSTEIGIEQPEYWENYIHFLIGHEKYSLALKIITESEKETYSSLILYQKAVVLFALQQKNKTLETLEEALNEDFASHKKLKDYSPNILLDRDIQSMIDYYEGE
jgi:tetratricopeptide (TPR) repeat protein